MSELVTTKISKRSLQAARVISGYTSEKQYEVIERVLLAELNRVEKENRDNRT